MLIAGQYDQPARRVRLRPIALPVEHGGWSLILEPILLGLLLAPSIAGICLSLAALSAFLLRHTLKIAIADWRQNRQVARTRLVRTFALIYSGSALLFLSLDLKLAGTSPLVPLLIAAPLLTVQLSLDFSQKSRALFAELAGSIGVGSLATAVALSGGWPPKSAFALWVIAASRSGPTILYLRARLRALHGKPYSLTPVLVTHILAIAGVILVIRAGAAPSLAGIAMLLLLLRAVVGLAGFDRKVTAKKLGLRELILGAITILLVTLGYLCHW